MDLEKVLNKRRSIRSFKDKEVPEETIRKLLENANKAPSAGNLQARDFVVIKDEDKKKKIAGACLGQDYVAEAPLVLVACANENRSGKKYGERARELYCIVDTSLAIQNLMLSAVDKGLGTVYVGAFNEEEVSKLINAPEHIKPIAVIPVGYSDEEPKETSRFRVDKLTHRDSF